MTGAWQLAIKEQSVTWYMCTSRWGPGRNAKILFPCIAVMADAD